MAARIWKASRNKGGLKSHAINEKKKKKGKIIRKTSCSARNGSRAIGKREKASLILELGSFSITASPNRESLSLAPSLSLICTIAQHNCGTISSAVRKISLSLSLSLSLSIFLSFSLTHAHTHTHTHTHIRSFNSCLYMFTLFHIHARALHSLRFRMSSNIKTTNSRERFKLRVPSAPLLRRFARNSVHSDIQCSLNIRRIYHLARALSTRCHICFLFLSLLLFLSLFSFHLALN